MQEGSWRVKHHLQAEPEAPAPSAEQQPDVATAAQHAPAEQQQPALPPETQVVTGGQMSAALANVGDLASMYPDSQVEPAKQVPVHELPPVQPEGAPEKEVSPEQQPQVRFSPAHTPHKS